MNLIFEMIFHEECKNPNNAYFRSKSGGMFMKSDYRAYSDRVKMSAKLLRRKAPSDKPIHIEAIYCMGTKRRKDLTNCGKLEIDALNGIVFNDDSQIVSYSCRKTYKKNEPYFHFKVYEIGEV